MRQLRRAEEFRAIQRESAQVVAILRKALFSHRFDQAPSPVQGGFSKPPSPSGGSGPALAWVIRPSSTRTYYLGAGKVTDRRNSTLRCYFRHCGW
jgi:hypothetical protein